MKRAPAPTRAQLLEDLVRIYGFEPVHDDEITVEDLMKASNGTIRTRMAATRALEKEVEEGRLAPPVDRHGPNGKRLKAWRRLK